MPDIQKLTGQKIETGRWNISTFGRLFMASALPETVHTVLNIDCDTIVLGSLKEIFDTNMDGKIFGGISECINHRYKRNIKLQKDDFYFNAGVVYLNLDEIRKNHYEEKFIDYITKYGNTLAYLDQDVLNGVVKQECKIELPLKYNVLSIYFYSTYKELITIRRSNKFYSINEFVSATSSPCIVHFTTCFLDGLRPWIEGNKHPYRNVFLEYKEKSLWNEELLWVDNRKNLAKRKQRLLCSMPRIMMIKIASFLHGVLIPNNNYFKIKRIERQRKI